MATDLIIGGKDKLHEISMRLEQSHLVYLQTDDSPLKLQQRHKLEGFIKEYLCLVPNENKYVFQETADILHRSAATLQDFSGYRAVTAWSAISLYAANLLAQPWRKEYRTLMTYSGYYKHEVEANLIGAELMFEQMGYKHAGLGILTLEGPIDPDKVSNVSRDAIVAFVECQILKQIWESISQNYSVSWLEVLEFRENHVGTPEQAIRALNYRFLEKLHQNRIKSDCYRDYRYPQSRSMDGMAPSIPYHMLPTNYGMTMPSCQPDYRYIEDANTMLGKYKCFPTMDHDLINRCNTYGCLPPGKKYVGMHTNPYCTTVPGCATTVPTAKLIEVDMPLTHYDKMYNRKFSQSVSDVDELDYYRKLSESDNYDYGKVEKKSTKHGVEKNSIDMWDFVYKNLERQGYSKDHGNIDDVLRKKDSDVRTSKQKSSKSIENEDKCMSRNGKKKSSRVDTNEIDLSVTNGRNIYSETLPFKKKSSSFDLSDSHAYKGSTSESQFASHHKDMQASQTLPIQRSHRSSEQIAKITDTIRSLELSQSIEDINDDKNQWNCATCTFLNTPDRQVCEMCGKSRRLGNEDKPLISGGKQCQKCTLVNEKNVSTCEVCNESLLNSPTYV